MHDINSIPSSIFLSGVEGERYWEIVVRRSGIKNVLTSYHYFQSKPKDTLKKRLELDPEVKVFIDSGAYTYTAKFEEYKDKPLSFWESIIEKYVEWIKEQKEYIFACADMDLDRIVGSEQVNRWRAKYFEPLKDLGINVCYIWHNEQGRSGWENMCQKYDYVGMSLENDSITLQALMKMINTAKKYNTLVHGMAITKVDILVRIPLFSCDSTTWIVGQQYGELNWFDGRGMKRLSKKDWRTTYKTRLLKEPFNADWDKLINGMGGKGDTYELLRLNVIAYKLAEEHIRKRLGAKMYWLNREANKVNKNWEDIKLPDSEWFNGDQSDYKDYASILKLSESMSKEETIDILRGFHMYIHNDEDMLSELEDSYIIETCQQFVDKSVDNREEAIEKITQFYKDNLMGVRNDFVEEEINENQVAKEREKYLEEDEVLVEIPKEEIDKMLPPPKDDSMPEVSAYDEELKRAGIIAVRDGSGKFIKGNRLGCAPKSIYSDKYPTLNCNSCYKSGDCPQYKEGYVCAYKKIFKKFDTRNSSDITQAIQSTVNFNMERMQRAMMFETMDGGMPTQEVSNLIEQNIKHLVLLKDLMRGSPQTVLEQRRTISQDGTQTLDTRVNINPVSGGILSRIFGGESTPSKYADNEDDIIDVTDKGSP